MVYDDRPHFPTGARIAGIIWIVVGVLGTCGSLWTIASGGAAPPPPAANANNDPQKAVAGAQVCGTVIAILFYAAFLFVGIQTVKGTAKGLLGNGIGSLVFSLILLAIGGLGIVALLAIMQRAPNGNHIPVMIAAGLITTLGLSLFLAGILGIVCNSSYKDWRKAEGLDRPRRRKQDDDEYDRDDNDDREDRDDRRRRREDRE